LVVAKVRERLAVGKRAAQKIDMQKLNLKMLKRGKLKEMFTVETSLQLWKI
jgi:hypothetical protein